jgi:hypothetical protein
MGKMNRERLFNEWLETLIFGFTLRGSEEERQNVIAPERRNLKYNPDQFTSLKPTLLQFKLNQIKYFTRDIFFSDS